MSFFHFSWQCIGSNTRLVEREYLWIFQWNTAWGIYSVIFSVGKAAGSSDPTVCGICKDKSIMSAFSRTLISPLIGHKGERLSKLLWWTGIYGKGKDNAFCFFSYCQKKWIITTVNERLEMWANAVSQWPYLQWRLCVATVGDPRTVVGVWNGVIHIQHLSGSTDCAVNTPSSACFHSPPWPLSLRTSFEHIDKYWFIYSKATLAFHYTNPEQTLSTHIFHERENTELPSNIEIEMHV